MGRLFEELDNRTTPIGTISLRRRREPKLDVDVLEIKLDDEFLMSSLFTASELALADLALFELAAERATGPLADPSDAALDVIVGGLGLGYTARAVLGHATVRSLHVIELLEAVVDWHRTGLLPLGAELVADERCRLVCADFFALAASEAGFDVEHPGRTFDAILLDIDHSPAALLDERSAAFYSQPGLERLARHLAPGGVFALWSNDLPDPQFTARLERVFERARAEPVTFHNPLQDRPFTQTVYLARSPAVTS